MWAGGRKRAIRNTPVSLSASCSNTGGMTLEQPKKKKVRYIHVREAPRANHGLCEQDEKLFIGL